MKTPLGRVIAVVVLSGCALYACTRSEALGATTAKATTATAIATAKMPPRCGMPFVTIVLPSIVNTNQRVDRLRAIAATWGSDARAVFVAHAGTPEAVLWPSLTAPLDECDTDFPQAQGVARLRWVLSEVWAASANGTRLDFVFMCNDHTAVVTPNLKCYLRGLDAALPTYVGHALAQRGGGAGGKDAVFNSGAAGYVLSRGTLALLARRWALGDAACSAPAGSKWLQGNPGLVLALCLGSNGAPPIDTRDASGRHRFHAFGVVRTALGTVDDWYKRMHERLPNPPQLLASGEACCSAFSVSFHYVEAAEQRVLHGALRELDTDRTTGRNLSSSAYPAAWLSRWPPRNKLGGYSTPLPHEQNDLAQIRKVMHNILLAPDDATCL